jgi:hypothetical protein
MGLLHWWFELPLKKSCGHSDGAPSSEVRGNGVVGPQEFLLEWRYAATPGVEMPGMVWGTSKFRFKSPVTCMPQAPGVGAAATGYTTKNDRNSNLFIHFIFDSPLAEESKLVTNRGAAVLRMHWSAAQEPALHNGGWTSVYS